MYSNKHPSDLTLGVLLCNKNLESRLFFFFYYKTKLLKFNNKIECFFKHY